MSRFQEQTQYYAIDEYGDRMSPRQPIEVISPRSNPNEWNHRSQVLSDRLVEPPISYLVDDEVPIELRLADRWVTTDWIWADRINKWHKSVVDLELHHSGFYDEGWSPFKVAYSRLWQYLCDHVGFVLGEAENGSNFAGIDIDNCRNPETGELTTFAQTVLAEMDSYAELSATGTGVKIICFGKLPANAQRHNRSRMIEVIDSHRCFTITGERLAGMPLKIADRSDRLAAIWKKHVEA